MKNRGVRGHTQGSLQIITEKDEKQCKMKVKIYNMGWKLLQQNKTKHPEILA